MIKTIVGMGSDVFLAMPVNAVLAFAEQSGFLSEETIAYLKEMNGDAVMKDVPLQVYVNEAFKTLASGNLPVQAEDVMPIPAGSLVTCNHCKKTSYHKIENLKFTRD